MCLLRKIELQIIIVYNKVEAKVIIRILNEEFKENMFLFSKVGTILKELHIFDFLPSSEKIFFLLTKDF